MPAPSDRPARRRAGLARPGPAGLAGLAVLAGALALSGCATPADPGSAAATSGPPSANDGPAPSAAGTATDDAAVGPEPGTDAAAASAEGAYLDYEDGAIEATPGPKALFFHASWCPKCRALDEELRGAGAPDGLTVFKVDYDSRTDLRQRYGVTLQTTIVFVDDAGEKVSSVVLYDDPSVASLEAAIP
jgi:thiol-disulfide isomerase/thioredoxin